MIPVYEAKLKYEDDGIFAISLVDMPAVESNFIAFSKNNKPMKFAIQDAEEHKVIGVIMRCDYQIYRYDENIGEYYIVYKKDTIEEMARRMMKTGSFKNIDLDHDGIMIEGVELIEVFIKDVAKGINPAGFDEISDGSLFGVFKITDENIWAEIKAGKYMGYSLEGYFCPEKTNEYKYNSQKQISEKTMKKIKKMLFSVLKFGQVHTDKGTIYWVGEEDLKIGDELFTEDGNGDRVKVEDGEYTMDNGTKITVEDGLVTYIEEPVISEYRKVTKLESEATDEIPVEEIVEEVIDTVEDTVEELVEEAVDETVAEEVKRDLEAEIDDLKAEIEALKETIVELLQTPAAEPVADEYKKMNKGNNIPAFGSKHKLVGF